MERWTSRGCGEHLYKKELEVVRKKRVDSLRQAGSEAAWIEELEKKLADKDARIAALETEITQLKATCAEESRLNGMGEEREAALLGKTERFKKMVAGIIIEAGIYRGIPEMEKIEQMARRLFEKMEE